MGRQLKLKDQLKRLLDERRITARQLSRETGVPQATLAGYLAGRAGSRPEQVAKLADYFGVSMEFLLFAAERATPNLESLLVEPVFQGWLRVSIERAIPDRPQPDPGTTESDRQKKPR